MTEVLAEAEAINSRIAALLQGNYGDDRRTTLTLAYLNLSLDHHAGIVLLIRNKLYGPALALVRVVFEAMLRAHWVARCATPAQVDQVAEDDDFKFPKMDDLVTAVDLAFSDPTDQPLTFFRQAKTGAWKATNSYTHSGLRQLARQFREGHIEANYQPEDLVEALHAATSSVLLLGYLLAKSTGRVAEADAIEKLFSFRESGGAFDRASQ
jgi:hypothetical protein